MVRCLNERVDKSRRLPATRKVDQMVFGYLDAGTGSLVLQLLVGGFAGLATFVKFRWSTVKGWFDRGQNPEQ